MRIGLVADHRGYKLKGILNVYLQEKGIETKDLGTNSFERVDFPLLAEKLCKSIKEEELDLGIAICGTGIGMSIACNKVSGIYCAKVSTIKEAKLSKEHNNANVLAISGEMSTLKAKLIVKKFIKANFSEEEVYKNRFKQIERIEKKK